MSDRLIMDGLYVSAKGLEMEWGMWMRTDTFSDAAALYAHRWTTSRLMHELHGVRRSHFNFSRLHCTQGYPLPSVKNPNPLTSAQTTVILDLTCVGALAALSWSTEPRLREPLDFASETSWRTLSWTFSGREESSSSSSEKETTWGSLRAFEEPEPFVEDRSSIGNMRL